MLNARGAWADVGFAAPEEVPFRRPHSRSRFHTRLNRQVFFLQNFAPSSRAVGIGLGGQLSFDIIDDKWNVFLSGQAVGLWVLRDPNGQQQLQFGPALGLGTTFQWGF